MLLRLIYSIYRIYLFFVRPVQTGVRVLMIKDGQVLLVRQTYIPGWFMPGGRLKRGETLEQAARREVKEETGAVLGEMSLLGVYTHFKEWKTDHNIVFLSQDFTNGDLHDDEIAEVRYHPLEALPEDLWPGHRRRIEQFRNGLPGSQFGEW